MKHLIVHSFAFAALLATLLMGTAAHAGMFDAVVQLPGVSAAVSIQPPLPKLPF